MAATQKSKDNTSKREKRQKKKEKKPTTKSAAPKGESKPAVEGAAGDAMYTRKGLLYIPQSDLRLYTAVNGIPYWTIPVPKLKKGLVTAGALKDANSKEEALAEKLTAKVLDLVTTSVARATAAIQGEEKPTKAAFVAKDAVVIENAAVAAEEAE